jgi:hypothetical protein
VAQLRARANGGRSTPHQDRSQERRSACGRPEAAGDQVAAPYSTGPASKSESRWSMGTRVVRRYLTSLRPDGVNAHLRFQRTGPAT